MSGFSDRDLHVFVTPGEGQAASQQFEVAARESCSMEIGDKLASLKGAGIIVGIAQGTPEPKCSIDCTSILIAAQVDSAMHNPENGDAWEGTIQINFYRPGVGQLSYRLSGCKLSNGGGFDSKESGPTSKLEFMCTGVARSINGGSYEVRA